MEMLEDINNCIVNQLTSAGCVGWAFGGHKGKDWDNKRKLTRVHDWVEWIFIDHNNQPHS
jgi:hypothetical protein